MNDRIKRIKGRKVGMRSHRQTWEFSKVNYIPGSFQEVHLE
jgi:hypothetical protein